MHARKTKLIVALTGMVVVLICELVAIFERALATTSPAFHSGLWRDLSPGLLGYVVSSTRTMSRQMYRVLYSGLITAD
jgi:hypothetical protein